MARDIRLCSVPALLLLALTLSVPALAQDAEQEARIRAALASPERPAGDRDLDAARKPLEVIRFLGIETGMTVLDVFAVAGWYSEVLSAAVGPSGKVYAHNPSFFVQREGFVESERQRHARLGNVEPVHGDLPQPAISGRVDAALSNLNLHDVYNGPGGEDAAVALARGVYEALKPGGVFGLIDHAGIEGQDNASFHRMQVAQARDVLTKAGFVVEAESDALANPADDHMRSIRDPSLNRNTDRFLLRARKPGG